MPPIRKTLRIILLFIFLGIIILEIKPNDSVFYGSGGNLVPSENTRIELRKEILTFEIHDEIANVTVDFDFWNPGNDTTVIVGFVISKGYEGMDLIDPEIFNFKTWANGIQKVHKITEIDGSAFDRFDLGQKEGYLIYYFPILFRKGNNKIIHTYEFWGGADSGGRRFYNYTLSTGNLWANKQIDDFTLIIKNNSQYLLDVPNCLAEGNWLDWKLLGKGKFGILEPYNDYMNMRLDSGELTFQTFGFKPNKTLSIGAKPIQYMYGTFPTNVLMGLAYGEKIREGYSKTQLGILRNTFFAIKGYKFKDQKLFDYFDQFCWYDPKENLSSSEILDQMEDWEKESINSIRKLEKIK